MNPVEPDAGLTARVAAYIRGGAYPEVAAQAARAR